MGNFVLPAQLSPCLRVFIASLLYDSVSSGADEIYGLPIGIAISAENHFPCRQDEAFAQKLVARVFSGRGNAPGGDGIPGHGVTEAVGGDVPKGR